MESEQIIKSKLNLTLAVLYLVGGIFFGYLIYITLTSEIKVEDSVTEEETSFLRWMILILFCVFSIVSLYKLANLKTFLLTKQNLIIIHPFLFYKKAISISKIVRLREDNTNNYVSRGKLDIYNFNIRESEIELNNGAKIKFDSSITNYTELKKSISELVKN